jgi:hypothetical protein
MLCIVTIPVVESGYAGEGVVSMTQDLAREVFADDESRLAQDFITFLKAVSARRHPSGRMRRFNQARAAGCVEAEFTIGAGLPAEHRVGLFAERRSYSAWIRFSNAASDSDREKDIRGMSIQLRGVAGENLTSGATTQDFILNSHPVMVAPDTRRFLELLQAMEASGLSRVGYFLRHPKSARIGLAARQNPTSHLDIPYWSTTPYLFGPGRAVKYLARPSSSYTSRLPDPLTDTYLRENLAAHLAQEEARFEVLVQFQQDARRTPIEDASVEWKARDAPYHAVAEIRIPPQRVDAPGRDEACEETAFNPWHCLVDHRPLGSFNRARKEIYRAMAEFRHTPRPISL